MKGKRVVEAALSYTSHIRTHVVDTYQNTISSSPQNQVGWLRARAPCWQIACSGPLFLTVCVCVRLLNCASDHWQIKQSRKLISSFIVRTERKFLREKMSQQQQQTVRITTTETTTSTALVINSGYLKTPPGLLKVIQFVNITLCNFPSKLNFFGGLTNWSILVNLFASLKICVCVCARSGAVWLSNL